MSKELRPFQIKAHEAVESALKRGVSRQLVVIPTGGGKTFLTVKLIERLGFTRGIWITDRDELLTQSSLAFIRNKFGDTHPDLCNLIETNGYSEYMRNGGTLPDGFKMGLIKADVFQSKGNVIMASAQTLHRKLDRFEPDEFQYVICDEAHLFLAPSMVKSVNYFTPQLLLGLTATGYRADGLPLSNIFDELVYEYEMRDAIRDGYLCELDAVRVKTNVNLDSVRTTGGDFNQKDLADEVNTLPRNLLVADSYLKYAEGRQGIFFAVDIQHCIDLQEAFLQKGVNATAVSSNEELTGDRSQKIRDFKNGKYDVIINVALLIAGFDHPDTGVIGCAAPTKSKVRYVQSVGRGTRLKSKEFVKKFGQNAIIIDYVDSTRRHNLVNAHELDKELSPEDRVFITSEDRQKLIDARMARIARLTHVQEKDEIVKLFSVPKVKMKMSVRGREPATEAQLSVIKNWGYSIEDVSYTKSQIQDIFMQQPINANEYFYFKNNGYDVSGMNVISKAQAAIMRQEIETRNKKQAWRK